LIELRGKPFALRSHCAEAVLACSETGHGQQAGSFLESHYQKHFPACGCAAGAGVQRAEEYGANVFEGRKGKGASRWSVWAAAEESEGRGCVERWGIAASVFIASSWGAAYRSGGVESHCCRAGRSTKGEGNGVVARERGSALGGESTSMRERVGQCRAMRKTECAGARARGLWGRARPRKPEMLRCGRQGERTPSALPPYSCAGATLRPYEDTFGAWEKRKYSWIRIHGQTQACTERQRSTMDIHRDVLRERCWAACAFILCPISGLVIVVCTAPGRRLRGCHCSAVNHTICCLRIGRLEVAGCFGEVPAFCVKCPGLLLQESPT